MEPIYFQIDKKTYDNLKIKEFTEPLFETVFHSPVFFAS